MEHLKAGVVDFLTTTDTSKLIVLGTSLVVVLYFLISGKRNSRTSIFGLGFGTKDYQKKTLSADKYVKLFGEQVPEIDRLDQYEEVVNSYYDLATDFYEYGWGTSFHFAQRSSLETLNQSLARHEHFLAHKLQLHSQSVVLDVGCGVGGPAREIARFSNSTVIGLNNNEYQIKRAEKLTNQENLTKKQIQFLHGDFMNIPAKSNSFDAAYAIEATCHAPDRVGCYAEILKVVKPGGYFAGYEWCTTERYDKNNEQHKTMINNIQVGNGLPGVISTSDVVDALREAGWEVLEYKDLAIPVSHYPIPWYQPFNGGFSLKGFRTTTLGIAFTSITLWILETLFIVPKGTYNTQQFLIKGAKGLLEGGKTGTFTPMFFFLCRKPQTQSGRSRSRSGKRK